MMILVYALIFVAFFSLNMAISGGDVARSGFITSFGILLGLAFSEALL